MCMTKPELDDAVKNLKELKALQGRINDKIAALEDTIKEHMSDTETYTLAGDGYTITWNEIETTRIDTAALKRTHPDIAAACLKTSVTRRFIVS